MPNTHPLLIGYIELSTYPPPICDIELSTCHCNYVHVLVAVEGIKLGVLHVLAHQESKYDRLCHEPVL